MTIAVIDYGMGNLHSVAKALEHVSKEPVIITDKLSVIQRAKRLVLPGQGAIGDCIKALQQKQLINHLIDELKHSSRPLLGICLGQQMLFEFSEENNGVTALGIFQGNVKRFDRNNQDFQAHNKIPHMGWNQVQFQQSHPLWQHIADFSRFYFAHSYYVYAQNNSEIAANTDYAGIKFASAICRDQLFAVQFHPEKSAAVGLQLLANFCHWSP